MYWILALLGLYISFMTKYIYRKKRNKLSISYWVNDNWPELSQSVALIIALMIILVSKYSVINFDQWLVTKFPVFEDSSFDWKMVLSFAIGLCITEISYRINKRKAKWAVEDNK